FIVAIPPTATHEILNLSYYTAIILLIVYGLCLLFQLLTHTWYYLTEEDQGPEFTSIISFTVLLMVSAIVGLCGEFLVSSLGDIMTSVGLTKTFVGLILLPAVSKASECVTAATVAMKNEMQSLINTTAARSLQTALFITPFLVVLGWIIGQPMTLFFEVFQTVILFVSVLILNFLIQHGESNWFTGVLLLATYVIIVIACYFYPDLPEPSWVVRYPKSFASTELRTRETY
ncbi:5647_t:CDS:2, partial [Paraglomus occultum]